MTLIHFPGPGPSRVEPRPDALSVLATYLSRVYPARGHGATDCGEMLDGLTDAEHFVAWLRERGWKVSLA